MDWQLTTLTAVYIPLPAIYIAVYACPQVAGYLCSLEFLAFFVVLFLLWIEAFVHETNSPDPVSPSEFILNH